MSQSLKPIAFYLPQFHPIPENNEWWGLGFTEWTNVTKAKPLFKEHYQPRLPSDLGFYDLRLSEVREAQANLARAYGIHGFCYYHYWFNGKRLLERPFQEVLDSRKPDFPFCLCWANESWSRRWDGSEKEVLMQQVYSEEDDRNHIRWLARAFQDPRYIRINDKPLFLVYLASQLPNPKKTAEIWREEAKKLGIPDLFLCRVETHNEKREPPELIGFDAAVEFQPDIMHFGRSLQQGRLWNVRRSLGLAEKIFGQWRIFDYPYVAQRMMELPEPSYLRFPCVMPAWDNTARRGEAAFVLHNSSPEAYENWLKFTVQRVQSKPELSGHFFINAWNEWAEGAYLEPDRKWGRAYLEATKRGIMNSLFSEPKSHNVLDG